MCSWIANKKRWLKLHTDGSEKSICHVFWQLYLYTAELVNIVIRCLYPHHRISYYWFYFQVDFIITGTLWIKIRVYVRTNFLTICLFAIMHLRSNLICVSLCIFGILEWFLNTSNNKMIISVQFMRFQGTHFFLLKHRSCTGQSLVVLKWNTSFFLKKNDIDFKNLSCSPKMNTLLTLKEV